jgi:uncharacterized membrane protein
LNSYWRNSRASGISFNFIDIMTATLQDSAQRPPLDSPARVLELVPRCSLTPRGARIFVVIIAATTFAVAGLFALQGFWPVLPFAGLEIGVLIWAVRASMRDGLAREVITVSEAWITISSQRGGLERSSVFPRHWSRVTLHAPPTALHPSRLVIESHGRACEVGRFLTEDERRTLAVRLKQLVGNVNESPALT